MAKDILAILMPIYAFFIITLQTLKFEHYFKNLFHELKLKNNNHFIFKSFLTFKIFIS